MPTFTGDDGDNRLVGGSGDDTIQGLGGNDRLSGERGRDSLFGGDGNDILSADRELGFDNEADIDLLNGGAGDDSFFAGYGDSVFGGDGFDTVYLSYLGASAGVTGDTANVTAGRPLVAGGGEITGVERFGEIVLTRFNDRIVVGDQDSIMTVHGWDGDDTIIGQQASVLLYGGEGNDLLVGSTKNDVLEGGPGDDRLIGGPGNDTLFGGPGADRFIFALGHGADSIHDFEYGVERIDLSAIDADLFTAGDQAFTFIGTAAFTGVPGQLRASSSPTQPRTDIQGDIDGDGIADFTVFIIGLAYQVSQGDFLL